MATKKPKSTIKKPGPKEERLVVSGDPEQALRRLLKSPVDDRKASEPKK
jgi:hypothetical protein